MNKTVFIINTPAAKALNLSYPEVPWIFPSIKPFVGYNE